MSASIHLAPGVETTLLKTHFAVVTDAVEALRFSVKSNKFPPTVNLVRSFSSFYGFISQTILPLVTFLSLGTLDFGINTTVCALDLSDSLGYLDQLVSKVSLPNFPLWALDNIPVFLGHS